MYEGNDIQGWMSTEELKWLYEQASKSINVLEVGSWKGRSTHALCSGCKGIVYSVDTWLGNLSEINGVHKEALEKNIYDEFIKNMVQFKNLVILRMHSVRAASFFKDKWFDMIFIDAEHTEESFEKDLKVWHSKCKKLFCGHDSNYTTIQRVLNKIGLIWREVPNTVIWEVRI